MMALTILYNIIAESDIRLYEADLLPAVYLCIFLCDLYQIEEESPGKKLMGIGI